MPWSEEQKRLGRLELRRRRSTDTATSRRLAFLKAAFAALGALLLSSIFVQSAVHNPSRLLRVGSGLSAIVMSALTLVCFALGYVRFQDWRQGARKRA